MEEGGDHMKRIAYERLVHFLLRIAIAIVFAVTILISPIRLTLFFGFLLLSFLSFAKKKILFTLLHLTVFKLE